jgi:hypothetical protein
MAKSRAKRRRRRAEKRA